MEQREFSSFVTCSVDTKFLIIVASVREFGDYYMRRNERGLKFKLMVKVNIVFCCKILAK
jgi:hypothetical protein